MFVKSSAKTQAKKEHLFLRPTKSRFRTRAATSFLASKLFHVLISTCALNIFSPYLLLPHASGSTIRNVKAFQNYERAFVLLAIRKSS